MTHQIVAPPHMAGLSYAPAVRVGDQLHVSGQVGRDAELRAVTSSSEAHITAAFENLKAVLEAAGGTLSDIYELTTYHVDLPAQMPIFLAVKARYFPDSATKVAWTAVGVSALNSPDFTVEISAHAHLG